jgi:DNA-3-methyladenine glycosylase
VKPLPISFFRRPAAVVARDLLGATIVSAAGGRRTSGIIVETEAYLGYDDPASHAYKGRLHPGNRSLYGAPGTWYIYRSYGIHWCANLVCDGSPAGGAVLLRGIIPREGVETIRRRRGAVHPRELANGPGKLCQALGITRSLDGLPMASAPVRILPASELSGMRVLTTPRIGISKAIDWPLRFVGEWPAH